MSFNLRSKKKRIRIKTLNDLLWTKKKKPPFKKIRTDGAGQKTTMPTLSGFDTNLVRWEEGAAESIIMALLTFFFFGVFVFLADFNTILASPTTILYIILLLFGLIGNVTALLNIQRNVTLRSFLIGIVGGFLGFLGLMVMGLFFNMIPGYTLLESSPTGIQLNFIQRLAYQLSFVAFAEELVFRNTLPFLLFIPFKAMVKNEEYAMTIAFMISSALFGMVHFVSYGFNVVQILIAFIAGVILSFVRIFGNLFSSTFAHLLYNVMSLGVFSLSPQLGG